MKTPLNCERERERERERDVTKAHSYESGAEGGGVQGHPRERGEG